MGLEPVLDNHKNVKVRVEHTYDVQKILNAIRDAGALYLDWTSGNPILKRFSEAHRRGAAGRSARNGDKMNPRIIHANLVVKLKGFYREKTTMFFTFAFPIVLILVFGTIFMSQDSMEYRLSVQDLDQTKSSAKAVKALELNGKFKITRVDPSINAAQYVRTAR